MFLDTGTVSGWVGRHGGPTVDVCPATTRPPPVNEYMTPGGGSQDVAPALHMSSGTAPVLRRHSPVLHHPSPGPVSPPEGRKGRERDVKVPWTMYQPHHSLLVLKDLRFLWYFYRHQNHWGNPLPLDREFKPMGCIHWCARVV